MVRIVSMLLLGCLGGSQGPKALTIPEQALHRGVIALDQVVSPFLVNVPDAVEVRVITMIDFPDNRPIGVGFVSADRDWPMQPDPLDGFVEEGLGRLRVPPRGQPEIDHLTVGIHRPPKVAPFIARQSRRAAMRGGRRRGRRFHLRANQRWPGVDAARCAL